MPFPFEETLVRTVFTAVSHASFLKPIVVFFGSVAPWFIVGWFVVELFRAKSFKLKFYYFSLATVTLIISRGLITEAMRALFFVPRPFEVFEMTPVISISAQSGMPSGHMTFLIPIVLAFFSMRKKEGMVALIFTLLTGLSRIAAGVHWASDILVGILIGIISFAIVHAMLPKKLSVISQKLPEIDEPNNLV